MCPEPRPASVAVVIVNWNSGGHLDRALSALSRQTVRPARVIVVDNASSDGSADGLEGRHPGVEVIHAGANLGFAAGNNLGVRAADGCEWVALLNPDAFPEPDWLERMLAAAEAHPGHALLGARLLLDDRPEVLDGTGDAYHVSGLAWRRHHGRPVAEAPAGAEEVFGPCAAAALYRRADFLAVGGFEERYFCYLEDVDLALRLRLAGHRALAVPDAVVRHVGSALTGRESDFTVYHSHRNIVWTYVTGMPGRLVWLYLPQHLLMNLLTVVWFATRGQARVILRAKRDALLGLPWAIARRRRVQRARRVEPEALRRQMARGLAGYLTAAQRARRSRLFPRLGGA